MNEPNSRSDLIESARAGDADAFAQLVDPMRQSLRRYANSKIANGRLKIRFDIDDILQETLLLA